MNLPQSIGLVFILTGLAVINALLSRYGLDEIQGQHEALFAISVFTAGSICFLAGAK